MHLPIYRNTEYMMNATAHFRLILVLFLFSLLTRNVCSDGSMRKEILHVRSVIRLVFFSFKNVSYSKIIYGTDVLDLQFILSRLFTIYDFFY